MENELVAGRYRIVGELGSGAMGFVWRAHDEVLDREVALKELRVLGGQNRGEALERFVTEARAAARLSHPSIVTVHDVFEEADRVLLSMELLDGVTLDAVIGGGGLGAAARPIMREVAAALSVAHAAGVVHRDLKPENIVVTGSGRVVVCDFGLARIGAGGLTEVGTVMGTPGFMAPEQLTGAVVSAAADVFAWGAVAYELAGGRPAFGDRDRDSAVSLAYQVVHEEPVALQIDDDPALCSVVAVALRKDAGARFADGGALLDALDGTVESLPPPAGDQAASPAGGSRSLGWAVAAVALVALVGGLAAVLVVLLRGDPQTPPAVATREFAAGDRPPAARTEPEDPDPAPVPTPARTDAPISDQGSGVDLSQTPSGPGAPFVLPGGSVPCPGDAPPGQWQRITDVASDDVLNFRDAPRPDGPLRAGFPDGTRVYVIDGATSVVGTSQWVLAEIPLLPGQSAEEAAPNGCAWVNNRYLGPDDAPAQ